MRNTVVYGPAYLDRVVRIDSPLIPGHRFDGSVDGSIEPCDGPATLLDRAGHCITLEGINPTHRPLGEVWIDGLFHEIDPLRGRTVQVVSDSDHLGGMGAGYAAALGGRLISALGPEADPVGSRVSRMVAEQGIVHEPIRVADRRSDWSLIVSSGSHGDKLAVGFRGCHSSIGQLAVDPMSAPRDLLVVASLPNRLIAQALEVPARVRLLAPAMRNARDSSVPLASLAGRFSVLCLNRGEWESVPGRERLLDQGAVVAVTDGPAGCRVCFRDSDDHSQEVAIPAFPRSQPPRDTNRAGEAFASWFVMTLLDSGWDSGSVAPDLIREAAIRGSAAAALTLDIEDFGFPDEAQVNEAVRRGIV